MNRITSEERGYLAGILDGEGCIRICPHPYKSKTGSGKMFLNYSLIIDVAQRESIVVEKLKSMTGLGSIQFNRSQRMYNWHLSANQVIPLLKSVLPLLVLKKSQAELAIEFHSRINKTPTGNAPLTEQERGFRRGYHDRMKKLKKRGNA